MVEKPSDSEADIVRDAKDKLVSNFLLKQLQGDWKREKPDTSYVTNLLPTGHLNTVTVLA